MVGCGWWELWCWDYYFVGYNSSFVFRVFFYFWVYGCYVCDSMSKVRVEEFDLCDEVVYNSKDKFCFEKF